jgi:hypothetical protein
LPRKETVNIVQTLQKLQHVICASVHVTLFQHKKKITHYWYGK